jgi:hypothetical protein
MNNSFTEYRNYLQHAFGDGAFLNNNRSRSLSHMITPQMAREGYNLEDVTPQEIAEDRLRLCHGNIYNAIGGLKRLATFVGADRAKKNILKAIEILKRML